MHSVRVVNSRYLRGNTNTSGGLRVMTEVFTGDNHDVMYNTRPDARDVALLITDGYSTWDRERYCQSVLFLHLYRSIPKALTFSFHDA